MSGARPAASSEHVRRRFENQRRANTKPELRLRRELHRRGLRYRIDLSVLSDRRRRVDIVFPGPRVAVFVDGCFWHRCPQHGNVPKSNREWWRAKLDRNVERDRDTDRQLRNAGWNVVRIWEHEVRADVVLAADRIESVVRP